MPKRHWGSVGVDLSGPYPPSYKNGKMYDMIVVFIDRLTSMVHVMPTTQDVTSRELAEIMYDEIFRLHGLPDNLVSDRDVKFTSDIWRELTDICGIKLNMSTAFHPQSDGATERANRSINSIMRILLESEDDQSNWINKLSLIEFNMNCTVSSSTVLHHLKQITDTFQSQCLG